MIQRGLVYHLNTTPLRSPEGTTRVELYETYTYSQQVGALSRSGRGLQRYEEVNRGTNPAVAYLFNDTHDSHRQQFFKSICLGNHIW